MEVAGENILPNVRMQHPGTITVSQGRITLGAKLQGLFPPTLPKNCNYFLPNDIKVYNSSQVL